MNATHVTFQFVCFWAFALVAVVSALGVITLKNSVHAVLSLVLTFFSTACIWLLLQAEFLGIALVVVYVGAVMVLFLFVVMMLDMKLEPLREGFIRYLPVGIVAAGIMLAEMLGIIGVRSMNVLPGPNPAGVSNTEWLGHALFTRFLLPFEIAALILTVGLVAAVVLAARERTDKKYQNPSQQVRVRPSERVRLVKMRAEPGASTPTKGTPQ
ncbi:MAG TPA: NADH-quinone oxidoreductase subunit J [Rhodanobacteraceae bacterium]|jgi:NADH-quinone oxidoreductase subunit J|nr:NADH-quinone oxidoreductase subunit J [Rhodanobacteraceae bacterium]